MSVLLHRLNQPNTTGVKRGTYISMRVLRSSSFCRGFVLFGQNGSIYFLLQGLKWLTHKQNVMKLSVCSPFLLCSSYKLDRVSDAQFRFRDHFSNAILVSSHSPFSSLSRVLPIFLVHVQLMARLHLHWGRSLWAMFSLVPAVCLYLACFFPYKNYVGGTTVVHLVSSFFVRFIRLHDVMPKEREN